MLLLKELSVATAVGTLLSLLPLWEVRAITFTQISDTNTPIPGSIGEFTGFTLPSIDDDGKVAFLGFGPFIDSNEQNGIYIGDGESLSVVADENTFIPDGVGTFTQLGTPEINNGNLVFFGRSSSPFQQGVYSIINGSLSTVANLNTPIPEGIGTFSADFFESIAFGRLPRINNNSNVVFLGRGTSPRQTGIYKDIDGNLSKIADFSTPIPGGTNNFDFFRGETADVDIDDDNNVVLIGFRLDPRQEGVYIDTNGFLSKVADLNTPIPNETRNFFGFRTPVIDGGNIAFVGDREGNTPGSVTGQGVYISIGGRLSTVADINTPIPNGIGNFLGFRSFGEGNVSIDSDSVAFIGQGSDEQEGIYIKAGDFLTKVIDKNDRLNNNKIDSIAFSTDGLSGDSLAFLVFFDNGSQGIFRADSIFEPSPERVPEPTTGLTLLIIGILIPVSLQSKGH